MAENENERILRCISDDFCEFDDLLPNKVGASVGAGHAGATDDRLDLRAELATWRREVIEPSRLASPSGRAGAVGK